MNLTALWAALGVLIVSFILLSVISRRKKTWYIVYLANDDTLKAYRTGWDRLWRSDEAGIMVFHTEGGKDIRISKHWIIKIEED
jgi:hypothetical protein